MGNSLPATDQLVRSVHFTPDGLVPAIVQDADTNSVLMMAWMNEASLRATLSEGRTVFWSRSRKEIWRKGDTSGNVQELVSIAVDCDGDTLLVRVKPAGPACHTGARTCFDQSESFVGNVK